MLNIPSIRRGDIKTNCELVVVEVNPTRANKFFIYGFYRPPSTNGEYLLELKQSLSNEELNSTPLLLCGDFNFPDINWIYQAAPGLDNLPNMFCDIVSDTFLTQMNHSPTRITDNTENILDLVFTNQPERIQLFQLTLSDQSLKASSMARLRCSSLKEMLGYQVDELAGALKMPLSFKL